MKCDVIIPVGPGHEFLVHEAMQSVENAWKYNQGPFADIEVRVIDDTKGRLGRSKARNEGIKASTADWLFFLDADDLMALEAFDAFASARWWSAHYDAVWGQISEYRDGCILGRYQVPEITTLEKLLAFDPYFTLQMGFFVKREKMPLFDETMNCGEDWKVFLRLWKEAKCIKQYRPMMINRRGHHSKGPKSADGGQWRQVVEKLIADERSKANIAA